MTEKRKEEIIEEEFRQAVRASMDRTNIRNAVSAHIKKIYFDDLIKPHIGTLEKQVENTISLRPIQFDDIRFAINKTDFINNAMADIDTTKISISIRNALNGEFFDKFGNVKTEIIEECKKRFIDDIERQINEMFENNYCDY